MMPPQLAPLKSAVGKINEFPDDDAVCTRNTANWLLLSNALML